MDIMDFAGSFGQCGKIEFGRFYKTCWRYLSSYKLNGRVELGGVRITKILK